MSAVIDFHTRARVILTEDVEAFLRRRIAQLEAEVEGLTSGFNLMTDVAKDQAAWIRKAKAWNPWLMWLIG